MNSLIYGGPNPHLLNKLYDEKKIKVKFSIHSVDGAKKNLSNIDIVKNNLDINFEITDFGKSIYPNFYENNFNFFLNMFTRSHVNNQSYQEIKNHFAIFFHGFLDIIKKNKIELMIFFSLPHEGPDYILYKLAKSLKIKTILMHQSIFPNKYFTVKDVEDLGKLDDNSPYSTNIEKNKLDGIQKLYTTTFKARQLKLQNNQIKNNTNKNLRKFILSILKKLKIIYRKDFEKSYLQNLGKVQKKLNEILNIKKNRKIIFFPLHVQPELSTSLLGYNYDDQILVLERLNNFAKNEWIVIAKENPAQSSYQRGEFFFKRLKYLKNVYFCDRDEDTEEIINHSDLISTISGTIAIEGLLKSKKCLIFGNAWYKNLHGILKINESTTNEEINKFLNITFDNKKFQNDLEKLLSCCDSGIVNEYDYFQLMTKNYDNEKNSTQVINNINQFIDKNF